MTEIIFKSFKDLNDYLIENEMIELEELTEALLTEPSEEQEAGQPPQMKGE